MAFMMPVVKNDYDIYARRSPSRSGRRPAQSESAPGSLSCSPGSDAEERLAAAASLGCSPRRGSRAAAAPMSQSSSQGSLHGFHARVVEKLRRKPRARDDDASPPAS